MPVANILDKINPTLAPSVWQHSDSPKPTLKPQHAHWITHTTYTVLEQHGYSHPERWLQLVITGSITTYQYSDASDCDVGLFVDATVFPEWSRAEMIGIMITNMDGRALPGTPYVMQNYVAPHNIKPSDLYKKGLRSGYDIKTGHWIVPPDHTRDHDVSIQENGFYEYGLEQCDKLERLIRYEPDKAVSFWHQLHERRRRDMALGKGDFCLAPQTRVLTNTYEWVPLMEVEEGDVLVGFDEETPGGVQRGKQRTLQRTVVTSLESKCLPSYRVLTDLNEPVIASAQHMWLVRSAKRCLAWKKTEALAEGDRIIRFGATWDEANDQNEANYLAGLMDGEGHLTATGRLCFTQKEGLVLERAKLAFDRLGFRYGVYNKQHLDDYYDLASALQVHGGVAETMRFLHQIPSVRLRVQRPDFWLDREISPKGRYVVPDGGIATVQGVEFVGDHEVIAVGTTTKTLIAEGLFSHNSESNIVYKFLANRGLFDAISQASGEHIATASDAPPAKLKRLIDQSVDYGKLWINDDEKQVQAILGDADDKELFDKVRQELEKDYPDYETDVGSEDCNWDVKHSPGWERIAAYPDGPDIATASYTPVQSSWTIDSYDNEYEAHISGWEPDPSQEAYNQQVLDQNAGRDLEGLPGPVGVPGIGRLQFHGNADIQRIANEYNAANGLGSHPTDYMKVNPQTSAAVAQEYERMPHTPNDPETQQAYQSLAQETKAQYDHAVNNGYQFEFYPQGVDPYPSSPRQAVLDLNHNKHMYVYPTESGYGQEGEDFQDHPLLGDSGVRWNGQPVTHNDLFRAVHDFYGHAKEGLGFRADGEDNAYRQHQAMFSPMARRALASETRGQNSYVNYGPNGANNQQANQADTVFAEQKAGIMPDWTTDANLHAPQQTLGKVASTIAALVVEATKRDGGITIGLNGEQPNKGFAFSIQKMNEQAKPLEELSTQMVDDYINQHREELSQPGRYLGAWVNKNLVYIDVSQVEQDKQTAHAMAHLHGQLAMYDLSNFDEIPTTAPPAQSEVYD